MRGVARQFRVALRTVQIWVERAEGQRLDRVDFSDRSHAPKKTTRTTKSIESKVLRIRRKLLEESALGERGAVAIRAALVGVDRHVPSVRTIGRILARNGALDGGVRIRRPPPPRGWYLPDVARGLSELDSFDAVVGLVIAGGTDVEVLNGVSLHGGLVGSWPLSTVTAKTTVDALIEHWGRFGLPVYAQFDNDTRFQGAHQFRDSFGRVVRLCLALDVVPVFAPPRELGFQAAVESYNGRWQAKVWSRFQHASLGELQKRSTAYVEAHRLRGTTRFAGAPPRRPFPTRWKLDLQRPLSGRVVYLRRTDELGAISFLGRRFEVDPAWQHRLVRSELDLNAKRIRFHALRRREPGRQPLLAHVPYATPHRRFKE